MPKIVHPIGVFWDHIAAVDFRMLWFALALHVVRGLAVSRAWRNVIQEAYPDERVRWRHIYGAYLAGVGVNALIPARAGDAVRLYLVKHRVKDSTYTTLASSLAVMAFFDMAAALALFGYALSQNVLPSIHVIPHLPSFDFGFLLKRPRLFAGVSLALGIAIGVGVVWAIGHIRAFKARVAQAFTIMRRPHRYLRRVVAWQLVDWSCRIGETFFFLRAFHVDATLHNALIAQVAQSASTVLPISPGGIGTEQALLVVVLAGAASKTALLSLSVGMKLTVLVANLVLGFTALLIMARTLDWRDLRRRREAEETAQGAAPAGQPPGG